MLAIKFYHLRALIHRPSLSLQNRKPVAEDLLERSSWEKRDVLKSKRLCVASAQQTARMLYAVEDKANLVHEFPWWQMISCLICATSVLLVARFDEDLQDLNEVVDLEAIEEDAEVCFKVFEALSVGSKAAAVARDMIKVLRDARSKVQRKKLFQYCWTVRRADEFSEDISSKNKDNVLMQPDRLPTPNLQLTTNLEQPDYISGPFSPSPDIYSTLTQPETMEEVSEPVMWLAQFINSERTPLSEHLEN